MSTRRELKNNINELVAVATDWAYMGPQTPGLYDTEEKLRKLAFKVGDLQRDLDADAPANDRDTSIAAANAPRRGTLRRLVLGRFYRCGEAGLTCDELEENLPRTHQSVSSAINYLDERGLITDSGKRRPTRSGRDAIVFTVTPLGQDLYMEGER